MGQPDYRAACEPYPRDADRGTAALPPRSVALRFGGGLPPCAPLRGVKRSRREPPHPSGFLRKSPLPHGWGLSLQDSQNHSKPSLWQLPFRKLLSDGFHLPIRPIRNVLTVYRFDLPVSPVRDISRQHVKREYAEQQNQKEFFHCNYPATCSVI